jgi:hypothetical protein
MGIEVSILGSQRPAIETYFETYKSCPRREPSLLQQPFQYYKN